MKHYTQPPEDFSEEFLDLFKEVSVAWWTDRQLRRFPDAAFGSYPWQQNARWLQGLPEETIDGLERQWGIQFPSDYRFLLQHLNAADRPPGATWENVRDAPPYQTPFFCSFSFYNWLLDTEKLQRYFKWPLEGLLFDLEHSNLWRPGWGEKPAALEDQKAHLTTLVGQAPKLIPILEHSFLLAEPCLPGNPVLSIMQSDIVVFGTDLRSSFFQEFRGVLAPGRPEPTSRETLTRLRQIPFWGELIGG